MLAALHASSRYFAFCHIRCMGMLTSAQRLPGFFLANESGLECLPGKHYFIQSPKIINQEVSKRGYDMTTEPNLSCLFVLKETLHKEWLIIRVSVEGLIEVPENVWGVKLSGTKINVTSLVCFEIQLSQTPQFFFWKRYVVNNISSSY
jgi:hypothetical protein